MTNLNNIDGLLAQVESEYVSPNAHKEPLLDVQERDDALNDVTQNADADTLLDDGHGNTSPEASSEKLVEKTQELDAQQEIDEYGNQVPMENAAVRERLAKQARKHEAEVLALKQQMETMRQMMSDNNVQNYNQNDETNWESQLEQFIDHRLTAREQQQREINARQQMARQQAEFEIKFNEGASKYSDFESVVYGKPLTADMVLATQGMNDPAAFIYAAAKTQPQELDRISKIQNPAIQAMELGRLDERMRKARTQTTSAPKPIEAVKGDVTEKKEKTWNIDDKLLGEERRMRKERMR